MIYQFGGWMWNFRMVLVWMETQNPRKNRVRKILKTKSWFMEFSKMWGPVDPILHRFCGEILVHGNKRGPKCGFLFPLMKKWLMGMKILQWHFGSWKQNSRTNGWEKNSDLSPAPFTDAENGWCIAPPCLEYLPTFKHTSKPNVGKYSIHGTYGLLTGLCLVMSKWAMNDHFPY